MYRSEDHTSIDIILKDRNNPAILYKSKSQIEIIMKYGAGERVELEIIHPPTYAHRRKFLCITMEKYLAWAKKHSHNRKNPKVNEVQEIISRSLVESNHRVNPPYKKMVPRFRNAGLRLASPAEIMSVRNDAVGRIYQDRLWNAIFWTDCGIARYEKTIYLFPHSKILRKITPKNKFYDGIPLSEEQLQQAEKYDAKEVKTFLIKPLNRTEFDKSPTKRLWLSLAGGDEQLLERYIENSYSLALEKKGSHDTYYCYNSGSIGDRPSDEPHMLSFTAPFRPHTEGRLCPIIMEELSYGGSASGCDLLNEEVRIEYFSVPLKKS